MREHIFFLAEFDSLALVQHCSIEMNTSVVMPAKADIQKVPSGMDASIRWHDKSIIISGDLRCNKPKGVKMRFLACIFAIIISVSANADIKDILTKTGMPNMTIALSAKDLQAQEKNFPSRIDGESALTIALLTILHDARDIESPLSLFLEAGKDLLDALNRSSAQLFLIHSDSDDADRKPEHGEKLVSNWIFCLSLPDFSDHLFWIVVDRLGVNDPYVYGFN